MALVKCPECGREKVSDSAEACPDCGYGIKIHFDRIKQEEEQRKIEEEKKKRQETERELQIQERKRQEAENMIKEKETKKMLMLGGVLIAFIIVVIAVSSKVSHDNEIKKYCDFSAFQVSEYNTEKDCILALLKCEELEERLDEIIDEDLKRDKEKHAEIEKELKNHFYEKIDEIINNYNGELQYSASEIKATLSDEGSLILSVGEHYDSGDYRWAFSSYLTFFTDTYIEDCIYYIVKTAYPETFTEGIKDELLAVGVHAWGDAGQDMLDEILTYIDSTPEGRSKYTSYISTAKQQLYDKNEATGKTVNGKKPPAIGMTADEVRASTWGSPKEINKNTYSWGVKEQWVYSGYRYIYLEDGIVTSISE